MTASETRFDAFLWYAEDDRAWAEGYLLDALRQAGCRCLVESDLEPGLPRLLALERAVQTSRRVLLVVSSAFLAAEGGNLVDLLARAHGEATSSWPVIPIKLRAVELPPRLAFLNAIDALDPATWEAGVARLCAALQLPAPAAGERPRCPYPGMVPFGEGQALFFGRDPEIREIVRLLQLHSFLAVIGPSGSGKSSLVLAGAVPALQRSRLFGEDGWEVLTFRPGDRPAEELREALAKKLAGEASDINRLLIADQFEASFTQPRQVWEPFQSELLAFSRQPHCYVVLTMRADFYSDLMSSPLWSEVKNHRIETVPLAGDALREAIVGPAAAVGCFVDSRLVERLLADAAREPGALPFVQETLLLLWDRMQRRYLSLELYTALGVGERSGLQVAIAQRADAILASLSTDQQRLARRTFLRLVQFGEGRADTRRRLRLDDLHAAGETPAALDTVVNRLAAARLLTLGSSEVERWAQDPVRATEHAAGAEAAVDLSHEALLTGWPTMQRWILDRREAEQVRRRLEDKAQEWRTRVVAGRAGGLLDEVELLEAERWQDGADGRELGSSDELIAWIAASREAIRKQKEEVDAASRRELDEQRRRAEDRAGAARRLSWLVAGLGAALLVAIGAVLAAYRQVRISDSRQHAAEAINMLGGSFDRALVQSAAAHEQNVNPETRNSLATAVQQSPRLHAFLHGNPAFAWSVAWSDDDKIIASGNADGTITLWDADRLQMLCGRPLAAHSKQVRGIAFAPHRHVLASAGEDHAIYLWDVDGCAKGASHPEAHNGTIYDLSFSPDGRTLATAGEDGKVGLWDATTLRPSPHPSLETEAGDPLRSVAFSADGVFLAAGSSSGIVTFWHVATWETTGSDSTEHEGAVNVLRFSPVDAILGSGSDDTTVALWDAASRKTIGDDLQTAGAVRAMAFSADGRLMVTAGSDSQIRLWNTSHDSERPELLSQHRAQVNSVAVSRNGRWLVSAGWDGEVILWDLERPHRLAAAIEHLPVKIVGIAATRDGKSWATSDASGHVVVERDGRRDRFTVEPHQARVSYHGLLFLPDGRIAGAGDDGSIGFWDPHTGTLLSEPLRGHDGAVNQIALSTDGDTLASAGQDGTVRLWSLGQHRPLAVLRGHLDDVKTLAFSPTKDELVSGSDDYCVIVWDVRARRLLHRLMDHTAYVRGVVYSPDGQLLASGGADRKIIVWNAQTWQPVATLGPLGDAVKELSLSPASGHLLASLDHSHTVLLWDLRDPHPKPAPLPPMKGADNTLAFNRDGTVLAVGGPKVFLAETAHRRLLPPLEVAKDAAVWAVAFGPDGTLAAALNQQQVLIWGAARTAPPRSLNGNEVSAMALSPDGASLALGDSSGAVTLRDLRSHRLLAAPIATGHRINGLAISGDGRLLASAGADGTVRLWRLPGCVVAGQLVAASADEVNAVQFSPDGRTLAAAGSQGLIHLWRVDRWHDAIASLAGHVRKVLCLAFDPQAPWSLVSGGVDRNVVLSDTGRHLNAPPLQAHSSDVTALAFSSDGRLLASGGVNNVIMLWDAEPGKRIGTWMFAPSDVKGLAFLTAETLLSAGGDGEITRWDLNASHWREIALRTANFSGEIR